MREGSLEAPVRHPLDWHSAEFYDEAALDAELRRVFDICHGCRRCFNLCDSFPRLFDLVDNAPSEELDTVESKDFAPVVEACTLCDLCFMTKCPYVPPHEFNLDFPHLMLRYRAKEFRDGKTAAIPQQLAKTDRNGRLGGAFSPLANWATKTDNSLTRPVLEKVAGIDARAVLPKFNGKSFIARAANDPVVVNQDAPGFGRKAVLYATCFVNYHNPGIGEAARRVLALNGVETRVVYPECCGMPQLEQGNIAKVADKAKAVAAHLAPYIQDGWEVIALVPSCSLMLKFEWSLILPEDPEIKNLARATWDISEYIIDLSKKPGLVAGLQPVTGGVSLHIACHARAQNIGQKAAELLRLIPNIDLAVTERCSGHGGSWGVMKENFELAVKIGKPVARAARDSGKAQIASECPLAAEHIVQGMEIIDAAAGVTVPHREARHPIEVFAAAYGL
ncbi:MAG: heterodisulfide reductase-related iron-sulfur binding cluster [Alphaproteobacteria bacterium]|nr:heterodisulfide reductase-related iron-sulfur binding cluster [Alphaproteobacteria bacterium]